MTQTQQAADCATCVHYGANVRDTIPGNSSSLLNEDHDVEADTCCHPTSGITEGGPYGDAKSNQQGHCGHHGKLHVRQPEGARLAKRKVLVKHVVVHRETVELMPDKRTLVVDVEGRDGPTGIPTDTGMIDRLGAAKGRLIHARAATAADGTPVFEDWKPTNEE